MNDRGNLGYFQFPLFYFEVSKQHLPVNDTNDFFCKVCRALDIISFTIQTQLLSKGMHYSLSIIHRQLNHQVTPINKTSNQVEIS